MRELRRRTGYMHNRVRMITASFLIKHLMIDWRAGKNIWDRLLMPALPTILLVGNGLPVVERMLRHSSEFSTQLFRVKI